MFPRPLYWMVVMCCWLAAPLSLWIRFWISLFSLRPYQKEKVKVHYASLISYLLTVLFNFQGVISVFTLRDANTYSMLKGPGHITCLPNTFHTILSHHAPWYTKGGACRRSPVWISLMWVEIFRLQHLRAQDLWVGKLIFWWEILLFNKEKILILDVIMTVYSCNNLNCKGRDFKGK